MGRKPKTTVIDNKVSKLTKQELESREEHTPVCKSQRFLPPDTLSEKELIVWNQLVEAIRETEGSYISDADIMTMEMFCKSKVEYDTACIEWAKNPQYYITVACGKTASGEIKEQIKVNPYYTIKKDFSQIMIKYLSELGISPTGRAKQGIQATATEVQKEQNVVTALINRKGD